MIKFFRKIRQQLLTENKFSKYLLYAVGEILLVIIGIIIALQISNWNQNKQNQNKLNEYLNLLILDLEKDENILNQCLLFDEQKVNNIRKIVSLKKTDTVKDFKGAFTTKSLIIHDVTYKSMSSSNIFEHIKSPDIQNSISSYYSNLESVKRLEDRYLNGAYNSLNNQFFNNDDISNYFSDVGNIEDFQANKITPKLRAHLIHTANYSEVEVDYYKNLLNEIKQLTELLNGELNKQ